MYFLLKYVVTRDIFEVKKKKKKHERYKNDSPISIKTR